MVGSIASSVNASSTFANGGVTLAIELPASANVSYFGALDDKWDLMADAKWTGWSSIPRFTVVRTNGVVLTDQHWDYKDSWRLSAGANYHYNDQWLFRGGIAWDQTPTNDTERSVRLPDSDRVWFSSAPSTRGTRTGSSTSASPTSWRRRRRSASTRTRPRPASRSTASSKVNTMPA